MVIFGSGQIVSALADQDLIDGYRMIINPVILGKGNLLFKNISNKCTLKLVNTHTLNTGVGIFYYGPER